MSMLFLMIPKMCLVHNYFGVCELHIHSMVIVFLDFILNATECRYHTAAIAVSH